MKDGRGKPLWDENGRFVRGPYAGRTRCQVGEHPAPEGTPGLRDTSRLRGTCAMPAIVGSRFCKMHKIGTNREIWEKERKPAVEREQERQRGGPPRLPAPKADPAPDPAPKEEKEDKKPK